MSPVPPRPGSDPTPREMAVLRLLLETGSYSGAARELSIAEATARGHVARIRSRLGVATTVQAVWALRDRLVA